ncbi:MAG: Ger(x)C family spore germination protein [Bacillus sp. (in: Bacteria)]|nr:Ger(x)C family spore germination protein [Bacillus sp. (in: firmicutes)]
MRKFLLSFFFIGSLLLSSGCMGKVEINDLAMVMAVGIDRNQENNNIILTTQIAKPGDVAGGNSSGESGEPLWTVYGEGKTIFEAIRNIARFSSRRVFWAHNMVIVINEEVARTEGLVDIIDFFNRNNQLRMRTWIVVSEEKASEVVSTQTGLEIVPGMSIDNLFRYTDILAEAPRSDVMTLTASYLGEHTHPYLAMVKLRNRGLDSESTEEFGSLPQVELSGTAIFNKEKMVGKLTPKESRGFLWFIEPIQSSIIPLTCPNEPGRVSVELRDNHFQLEPKYVHGNVSFDAIVESEADLVELGCPTKLEHSELLDLLEKDVEAELQREIEMMLEKLQQEYKVDVLQLGRAFQGKFPKEWNKLKEDWDDIYPNVQVNISITVQLNNPLLLENPTRPTKD